MVGITPSGVAYRVASRNFAKQTSGGGRISSSLYATGHTRRYIKNRCAYMAIIANASGGNLHFVTVTLPEGCDHKKSTAYFFKWCSLQGYRYCWVKEQGHKGTMRLHYHVMVYTPMHHTYTRLRSTGLFPSLSLRFFGSKNAIDWKPLKSRNPSYFVKYVTKDTRINRTVLGRRITGSNFQPVSAVVPNAYFAYHADYRVNQGARFITYGFGPSAGKQYDNIGGDWFTQIKSAVILIPNYTDHAIYHYYCHSIGTIPLNFSHKPNSRYEQPNPISP